MVYGIVYLATNLSNNKKYVGQTIGKLNERISRHWYSTKQLEYSHFPFTRALKKYGRDNFKWEVLEECNSAEELDQSEDYWIHELNSLVDGGWGYNAMTGGGHGRPSEYTKKKMSEARHKWWERNPNVVRASANPNNTATERQCAICKLIKPVSDFFLKKNGNRHSYCSSCERERNRNRSKKYYRKQHGLIDFIDLDCDLRKNKTLLISPSNSK